MISNPLDEQVSRWIVDSVENCRSRCFVHLEAELIVFVMLFLSRDSWLDQEDLRMKFNFSPTGKVQRRFSFSSQRTAKRRRTKLKRNSSIWEMKSLEFEPKIKKRSKSIGNFKFEFRRPRKNSKSPSSTNRSSTRFSTKPEKESNKSKAKKKNFPSRWEKHFRFLFLFETVFFAAERKGRRNSTNSRRTSTRENEKFPNRKSRKSFQKSKRRKFSQSRRKVRWNISQSQISQSNSMTKLLLIDHEFIKATSRWVGFVNLSGLSQFSRSTAADCRESFLFV